MHILQPRPGFRDVSLDYSKVEVRRRRPRWLAVQSSRSDSDISVGNKLDSDLVTNRNV